MFFQTINKTGKFIGKLDKKRGERERERKRRETERKRERKIYQYEKGKRE